MCTEIRGLWTSSPTVPGGGLGDRKEQQLAIPQQYNPLKDLSKPHVTSVTSITKKNMDLHCCQWLLEQHEEITTCLLPYS